MIKVFDCQGVQRDWGWLIAKYGPLVVHPAGGGPGWRVVEIWENADPPTVSGKPQRVGAFMNAVDAAATMVVKAQMGPGQPAGGVRVAFYWPDADGDGNCGPGSGLPGGVTPGRCVNGPTNSEGLVGFGMGGGAYYYPPAIGPHAVWIYGVDANSDVVNGLGMLGGTNHSSLWPVYEWGEGEEPSPPEEGCPVEEIEAQLTEIEAAVAAVRKLLA